MIETASWRRRDRYLSLMDAASTADSELEDSAAVAGADDLRCGLRSVV